MSHIIYLFSIYSFLFLNFSSLYYQKKKKKKNLLPISSHILLHFLQHFPLFFAYLAPHYSLLCHYTSFIIFSFLYFGFFLSILFCINLISFLSFNLFFPTQKLWVLSLFSFGFVLFYNSNLRLIYILWSGYRLLARFGHIAIDVQHIASQSFIDFNFSHVSRLCNTLAHSLARRAIWSSHVVIWMEDVLPDVALVLQVDLNSLL